MLTLINTHRVLMERFVPSDRSHENGASPFGGFLQNNILWAGNAYPQRKYMNVSDVIKEANPKTEFISIEKGDVNLVMVFDHNALVKKNEKKIVRLYKLGDDGETVLPLDIDGIVDLVVNAVQEDVDVKELLTEVFKNTPPDLLLRLVTELGPVENIEVEASSEPTYHCCYSLIFGDKTKPGHIEIPISGGRYDRGG